MKSWLMQTADVWRLLRQLGPYLGTGRGLLIGTLASSLVMVMFEGIGVGLLVPLLSLLLGGPNAVPMRPLQWLQTEFPNHSPAYYVGVCCVAIVVAIALKNGASYVAQIFAARLRRRVATSLRAALFSRLQRASLDLFDRRPTAEIASVFLVETYRTTIAIEAAVGFAQRCGIALFYIAALFYISWPLTSLVVALGLGLASALAAVYRRLGRAGTRLTELNHRLSTVLEQSFAGVRVVRATNAQQAEVARFALVNDAQASGEEETVRAHALLFPLTETFGVMGAMTIVACAYIFFVRPGHMLSSYLLWYGFVLLRLLPLLNTIYSMQGHLFYVCGGIREVERWLSTPIYPERPFGAIDFQGVRASLRLEGVSYSYGTGTEALRDVDFEVRAGQTVAIVGSSGSGKSTLAALLLRLRAPSAGRIAVDGVDYWQFSPESWHRSIALVEQDAFLFHGTLRENVLYGWQDVAEGGARACRRGRESLRDGRRASRPPRDAGRRARRAGVGRPAPADRHRPGDRAQPLDPRARRGHVPPRFGLRTARPAGARQRRARPYHARHRAPPLDHPRRGLDRRIRARAHRRTGDVGDAAGRERRVRAARARPGRLRPGPLCQIRSASCIEFDTRALSRHN